jgi:hypothetical protein|tara:strand:- start:106 stop:852 length:747 start_codon:yes stop_codon:yes gene_type:complete
LRITGVCIEQSSNQGRLDRLDLERTVNVGNIPERGTPQHLTPRRFRHQRFPNAPILGRQLAGKRQGLQGVLKWVRQSQVSALDLATDSIKLGQSFYKAVKGGRKMACARYNHQRLATSQTVQICDKRAVLVSLTQWRFARPYNMSQCMKTLATVPLYRRYSGLFRARVGVKRPVVTGSSHSLTRNEDSAAVTAGHNCVRPSEPGGFLQRQRDVASQANAPFHTSDGNAVSSIQKLVVKSEFICRNVLG